LGFGITIVPLLRKRKSKAIIFSTLFLSILISTLFVNTRTIYEKEIPQSLLVEDNSSPSYLNIGKVNLDVKILSSEPVIFEDFRTPYGKVPVSQFVSNLDSLTQIDPYSFQTNNRESTVKFRNSSTFRINFDISSTEKFKVTSSNGTLQLAGKNSLRITPNKELYIISNNILSPPKVNSGGLTHLMTFYGMHPLNIEENFGVNYLRVVSLVILKGFAVTSIFFLLLLVILSVGGLIGQRLAKLLGYADKQHSIIVQTSLAVTSIIAAFGSLNYFQAGINVRKFLLVCVLIFLVSNIKPNVELFKQNFSFFLGIFANSPILLGAFYTSVLVSQLFVYWNIGLINTDTNGYYFQILDSLKQSYLSQTYEDYRGNFTGNGMRSLDHSMRSLFHFSDANQTIVLSSIFFMILVMLIAWEYLTKSLTQLKREIALLIIPCNGLIAGLWMEGYQTRWFGVMLGIASVLLVFLSIDSKVGADQTLKLQMAIVLSFLQLSLNPTFLAIPLGTILFSAFLLIRERVFRTTIVEIRFIVYLCLLVLPNFLWLRNFKYTVEQGTNGYLDQLANTFVIPFWNKLFFIPMSFGLTPWHNNNGSIYSIGNDKISLIFHNSLLGTFQDFLLSTEWINKSISPSISLKIFMFIIACLVLLFSLRIIHKLHTFEKLKTDSTFPNSFTLLVGFPLFVLLLLIVQLFIQLLMFPTALYVNSMTLLSNVPICVVMALFVCFSFVNRFSNYLKDLKRYALNFTFFFTLSCSLLTTGLEFSRWNSGYVPNNGFTYWSYHDLIETDLLHIPDTTKFFLTLNPSLSSWDNYLVANMTYRTLARDGRTCLNCKLRNNEVIIEDVSTLYVNVDHTIPYCEFDIKSRLVTLCPAK
jgi:hypothetical protein